MFQFKKIGKTIDNLWFRSGNILTVLSIIILPLSVVVVHIVLTQLIIVYYQSVSTPENLSENLSNAKFAALLASIFEYIVYIIVIFIYPPYPAPLSSERYFARRGEKAVYEYENAKRILYIAFPVFIIFLLATYNEQLILPFLKPLMPAEEYILIKDNFQAAISDPAFEAGFLFIRLIVIAGTLKIAFALARKQFKLYFAKGCFRIIEEKIKSDVNKNEVEEMKYVILGLNSYNSYIRRHLKLQIKNLNEIYSKLASSPMQKKDASIDSISKAVNGEDTLEPIQYLAKFLGLQKKQEILTHVPLSNTIKEWSIFATAVIPTALSIIRLSSAL